MKVYELEVRNNFRHLVRRDCYAHVGNFLFSLKYFESEGYHRWICSSEVSLTEESLSWSGLTSSDCPQNNPTLYWLASSVHRKANHKELNMFTFLIEEGLSSLMILELCMVWVTKCTSGRRKDMLRALNQEMSKWS